MGPRMVGWLRAWALGRPRGHGRSDRVDGYPGAGQVMSRVSGARFLLLGLLIATCTLDARSGTAPVFTSCPSEGSRPADSVNFRGGS